MILRNTLLFMLILISGPAYSRDACLGMFDAEMIHRTLRTDALLRSVKNAPELQQLMWLGGELRREYDNERELWKIVTSPEIASHYELDKALEKLKSLVSEANTVARLFNRAMPAELLDVRKTLEVALACLQGFQHFNALKPIASLANTAPFADVTVYSQQRAISSLLQLGVAAYGLETYANSLPRQQALKRFHRLYEGQRPTTMRAELAQFQLLMEEAGRDDD